MRSFIDSDYMCRLVMFYNNRNYKSYKMAIKYPRSQWGRRQQGLLENSRVEIILRKRNKNEIFMSQEISFNV